MCADHLTSYVKMELASGRLYASAYDTASGTNRVNADGLVVTHLVCNKLTPRMHPPIGSRKFFGLEPDGSTRWSVNFGLIIYNPGGF